MLSILPYTTVYKYKNSTLQVQCCTNELFSFGKDENNEYCLPLTLLNEQLEQQKEPKNRNSKIGAYLTDQGSGYSRKVLDDVELICYNIKIYVLKNLCRHVLDWYHLYLKNPGGNRLVNKIREVCSWKVLVMQAYLYANP